MTGWVKIEEKLVSRRVLAVLPALPERGRWARELDWTQSSMLVVRLGCFLDRSLCSCELSARGPEVPRRTYSVSEKLC